MTSRRLRLVRLLAILAGAACADSTGPSDVLVVSSVSISPTGGSIIVGQVLQFTATARTSSGIVVPNRTVTWSSSNPGVAGVSTDGVVTGVQIGGPVTITATIDGRTGAVSVTITAVPVSTVTVDPSEAGILVGGAVQLAATVRGAGGEILTGRPVAWSSSAQGIATVTTQGMVVGVSPGGPVSITATSEGKAGSALITVGARPASRLGFLTHPPNGVAGQALNPAVRVAVQDDIGNTVAGATTAITLALTTNPGGATLGGAATVNAVNGVASFPTLTLDKTAAGYILGASAIALSPTLSNPFTIASAPAAAITIATQPSASAASGSAFARQPVLQLRDGFGNPAGQAGVAITASLASGTGTLGGTTTVLSNASGVGAFTNLSITGPAGPYTLRFAGTGLTAAVSDLVTLGAGAATQLAIITQPSPTAQSGVALPTQPVVELRDGSGNPVAQAGVLVTVAVSAPGALGGTATVATNASGRASFAGLSIAGTAGSYTLSFSGPGLTGVTSDPIALAAGTATRLAMVIQPSATATVGVALAQQPSVRLLDGTGNPVNQAGVAVTVSIAAGAGVLGGTATVPTDANGVAAFSGLGLTGFAGPYVLNFAATGLVGVPSDPILLGTGLASGLAIATPPSTSAASGVAFLQQPAIQVIDLGGNPVSQAGVTVTAVLATGPGTLGGTLTAVTSGAGLATFVDLAITGGAGTYTIGFSAPGLGAVTSGIIGLGAGVATQLTITTQPSAAAQSGVVFGTQPVIQLRDAANNVVAQAGVTVTATITAPGTPGTPTLGGTVAIVTDAGGVATFTNLRITGLVGVRTLTFTAAGLASAVSGSITLSAGPAAQLAMVTQPSATVANTVVFPQQPAVRLEDGAGNPVAQAGTTITAAIATGGGALGGTLTAITGAGGTATFANLAITGLIGVRTLSFSAGVLTPATSAGVNITPGTQTQLAITTQPSASAQSGVAFAQQPVVRLRDVSGNNVSLAGISVSAAITPPGTGTLGGTVAVVTNGSGQAVFTNLMITGAAGARTLDFTSAGLSPATSTAVTLTAGTATQMTITTQPSAAAQSGVVLGTQPVIQLRDASNNPVAEAGRVITAVIASGTGTLGGTVTATTNASGVATFTNLMITGTVGNFTLRFDEPGLPSVTSNTIALSAGAAARLGITVQPSPTASSGVAFVQQPIIQILDAAGNNVGQAGTAVTATIALDAGGTLGGTTVVVTSGTGQASYTNLALSGTSGNYTLRFSATGLADTVSTIIGLGAGAPSKLSITTQPSASVVNGVDFPTQPVIQLRDAADNPVAQADVVVSVTILSGAGALSGLTTATTNASGVATFTNLRLTGPIGDRTLIFAASGFVSIASGTVTVTPGTPTALSLTTAPSGTARSSLPFAQQPVLQLRDQSGNAVSEAGRTVAASIASGAAAISGGTSVLTNASGQAIFTTLSITGLIGDRTLGFASAGLAGLTSGTITVSAGPATQLSITTQPGATSAVSGAPIDAQPVVRLLDGAGNTVDSAGASIAAVVVSGAAVLSGTTPVLTNPSGSATFANLVLTGTAGPHTLRFDATGLTSATSNSFSVTAGAATQVTITTAPAAAAQSGIALTTQPAIQLRDASSNPVGQAGVTVTATIASGPGGGSLTSATAITNGAGLATFAGLAITGTVGTYTLTFTGTGVAGTATSGDIVLSAGAAATLTITTPPSGTARSSLVLAQVPVVTVRDAALNPVAGITVTAALVGSGALSGTTSGPSDGAGQVTSTGLTISGPTGAKSLDFSSAGLTTVSSGAIALSAGPATKLGITTQPSPSVVNDVAFPVQPVIQLLDAANNPLDSAGATITAAITPPGTGTLGITLTALTVGGTGAATFTDLQLTGLIGDRTLTFSATGLTSVISNTVTVTPGALTQLAMVQQPPATIANGAIITPNPSVRLRDVSGNNVLTAGTAVEVAFGAGSDPGATLGGTLSQNTDASGIATFPDLTITGALGARTLAFTSGVLTGVTSTTVTTTAGAADTLTITTPPAAAAQSGIALTTQPAVQLRDASSNPVSQSGVTVTASIASGPVGGSLTSATAITNGAGLATFAGLAITGTVGTYTLTFTGTGVAGTATSGDIVLSAGAATKLSLETPPSGGRSTIALGTQPTAQLRDAGNNPVATGGVLVTATIASSPGGSPAITSATATTDGTGLATFSGLALHGLVGPYTITFTGDGVATPATSGTVTLTAGPARQLSITTQPATTSAVNGGALDPQPVIQLRDSVGNVVDSAGATVTAARLGGTASLTGTTDVVTNASGVANFTDLVLTGIAGAHTLQFTAAPLTPVTSASFNLTPGAAASVTIQTDAPAAATNGVTLSQSPVVEVRDASTNLITGTSVVAALATGAGTGTLNGTLSVITDGLGQATFSDLNIVGTIGTYSIQFTAGTGSATSTDITLATGAATALAITTQPEAAPAAGVAFAPQPVVRLVDSGGNTVTTDGITITAVLQIVSGTGVLGGTAAANTVTGVSTWTDLSISLAGSYTIRFDSPGLTSVTSAAVNVP